MQKTTLPVTKNIDNICPPAPGKPEAESIIQYWSSFPCFTRHTDPTKKAYSMSLWMLKTLFEGMQGEKMPMDDDFLSDNSISNAELCHKFTVEEIKSAIGKYAYMSGPEYTTDKSKWSRSLDHFIYNDKTKRSFFFTLTGDRDVPGAPTKPLDQAIVDLYQDTFFYRKNISPEETNILIKSVNYIVMQQRDFQERFGQFFHYHPLKNNGFYNHHIKYIEYEVQDNPDFSAKYLGAYTYKNFGPWLANFHDIILTYGREEIERAKVKYAKDEIIIQENIDRENRILAERAKWASERVLNVRQVKCMSESVGPRTEPPMQPEEHTENISE